MPSGATARLLANARAGTALVMRRHAGGVPPAVPALKSPLSPLSSLLSPLSSLFSPLSSTLPSRARSYVFTMDVRWRGGSDKPLAVLDLALGPRFLSSIYSVSVDAEVGDVTGAGTVRIEFTWRLTFDKSIISSAPSLALGLRAMSTPTTAAARDAIARVVALSWQPTSSTTSSGCRARDQKEAHQSRVLGCGKRKIYWRA